MSFTRDMKRDLKKHQVALEKTARKVVLDVFGGTIESTPVGNPDLWKSKGPAGYVGGRLRNNWQCSANSPDTFSKRGPDKGGSAAQADARKTVRGPGIYYLTNNMPYAKPVEYDGHSKQAPSGMARINIRRLNQYIRRHTK